MIDNELLSHKYKKEPILPQKKETAKLQTPPTLIIGLIIKKMTSLERTSQGVFFLYKEIKIKID